MFGLFKKNSNSHYQNMVETKTYIQSFGNPVWSDRNYHKFSSEAYVKNVIAHRCINMIATGASSVPLILFAKNQNSKHKVNSHKILDLLNKPNSCDDKIGLFNKIFSYKLISGNAYLRANISSTGKNIELSTLRPDRLKIIAGKRGVVKAYQYNLGSNTQEFSVNQVNNTSQIIHFKNFNPLDDWYGLSAIEAAAYSIDQHNQAGIWNQSLLQNGARPSGALVLQSNKNGDGQYLTDEQYNRIKQQLDEKHSGADNSGKPILLEGGLDWKEMSISPKDMDFINAKNSSARDIALAFGVPPQLLGIPGDNTYSNMAEARLALWEQTILPHIDSVCGVLNNKLLPLLNYNNYELSYDINAISALTPRREALWNRIKDADFLSNDEKREMLGLGSKKNEQ